MKIIFLLISIISSTIGETGIPSLSSQHGNSATAFIPQNCVDGNSDTICHSKSENNPFFMLEYPSRVSVTEVRVQARNNVNANRAKNVVVTVTDTKPTPGSIASGTQLGSKFVGPASAGEWISFKSVAGIVGKYVVVQQQYNGILNLAEVQVKEGCIDGAAAVASCECGTAQTPCAVGDTCSEATSTCTPATTGNQNPLNNFLGSAAIGAGAVILGQGIFGNINNCGGGFGRRRRQAGDPNDPNKKFFGLFGGNDCNNPCGRKKRQTGVVDTGGKVDSKFFGLFGNGGGSSNCGSNANFQKPPGFNNNFNRVCQCTNLSKKDKFGYEEAQCHRGDHTGRRWCYSTSNSNCGDAVRSKKYPSNHWSYLACSSNTSDRGSNKACKCANISKTDNQGIEEAKCAKGDDTGRRWCYTTSNSSCGDAVNSKKYPSNPWSYLACSSGSTSG